MSSPASQRVFVKHPGCPQWGLGYLVEERDEKRFYEFEDGQTHSIAKPFWPKLEPVQLPEPEATEMEAKISRLHNKPTEKKRARPTRVAATTFDEQLARFAKEFPGGFTGDIFTAEERGVAALPGGPPSEASPPSRKKLPKAYKEQAIGAAQATLEKAEVEALLAAGKHGEIIDRVKRVHQAAGGLLHPLGDLIPFGKMPAEHQAAFAEAVVGLLFGADEYGPRFAKVVAALGEDKLNTWPLATVLSALVQPTEHVFVKPSFFEKQAAVIGYKLAYDRSPTPEGYARMLGLAREVEKRLGEAGVAPRDLLDVYSFIWRMNTPPKAPPGTPKVKAAERSQPISEPPPSD